jgi:hypothetical protein
MSSDDQPPLSGQPDLTTVKVEGLVHDINNVAGRLLSVLYLCMSDVDEDHPVRGRLEVANDAALELRSLTRRLESVVRRNP